MSIARGVRGGQRLLDLQIHRLGEFHMAFDRYLNGRCPTNRVTERARKMLECGLPGSRPNRRNRGG